MKRFILSFVLFLTLVNAEYITLESKTVESVPSSGGTEIYFGTISDWSKEVSKIQKSIAKNGINGVAKGLGTASNQIANGMINSSMKNIVAGAGIGIVYGLLDPLIMSGYEDQNYVLIKSFDMGGKKELRANIFVGDKHPALTEEQIHQILNK